MFNVTKTLSPDVVDVTPMVLITLVVFILLFLAFAFFETLDLNKKVGKILFVAAWFMILVSLLLNFMLIKISIDAGIEWCKNRYGITEMEVQNDG